MKKFLFLILLLKLAQGSFGLSCVKCESSYDETCHFLQSTNRATECAGGLPVGVEDRCFIQFTEMGVTVRGCLSENPHMLEVCESGTGNCQFCNGEQCNIDQTMREVCAICDSATDANCASSPTSFVDICPFVYEYEAGGCYLHKRIDGTVERGCMVSGTNDFVNLCRSGEECKICRGQTCNTKVDFQQCHVCDSEAEVVSGDLTCLSNPGSSPTTVCQAYGDQCAQLVVPNGKTVRGCAQEIDDDITTFCPSNNCQLCYDSNCNSNVFPQNRITCHQCNDAEDCHKDMTSIGNVAYPCRNYLVDDQCYAVQDGEVVYRGCMSDRTVEKSACEAAGESCIKCTGQGCNFAVVLPPTEPPPTTEPPTTTSPLPERSWCHQCSGEINSACSYHRQSYHSLRCDNDVQGCYTHVQNGVIRRGCLGDGYCDSNDCETCELTWHCNSDNKATMSCYQCNSLQGTTEDREMCEDNPEELTSTPCALNNLYKIEDAGCYSMRLNATGTDGELVSYVRRGCKYMMVVDARCLDPEDDSCIMCDGDGCNTHEISFSGKINPTAALLILPLLIIVNKLYQ